MDDILYEIPPLSSSDCFYIVERRKHEFNYPIHRHKELEINFVEGGAGAQRVVGDSIETIDNLDLAIIGSEDLEHAWNQGQCKSREIREITIQFDKSLLPEGLLSRNQFASIKTMLTKAKNGIAFPPETIVKAYYYLDSLAVTEGSFEQLIMMLNLLYTLSQNKYKVLASTTFARKDKGEESRRIEKVKDFVIANCDRNITLNEIADIAGMSPSSFSRFFKSTTGKTLTAYVLEIRLGVAARDLVNTTNTISEICYSSGFNNISNFNRLFKRSKGITPKEFRQLYKKHKIII
ncbi:MAG: AraC family transcriptional regulator [Bacteroidales bacterium]|nr:AraC family transcriptional regulator [Bacteroidales bacterium]